MHHARLAYLTSFERSWLSTWALIAAYHLIGLLA